MSSNNTFRQKNKLSLNKHFLNKIIKEEIKKILYDEEESVDSVKQKLIRLFVDFRSQTVDNPLSNKVYKTNIKEKIRKIAPGLSINGVIELLRDAVDPQLFDDIVVFLTSDEVYSDKLDNFGMSSPIRKTLAVDSAASNINFRVPKSQSATDKQLDTRKDRKNLIQP